MDTQRRRAFWTPQQGAVSLTFDDGRPTQLTHAVPLLDKYNLKGTFYILPRGDDWREKLAPWAEAARHGHEIGNHGLDHICSSNFLVSGRSLETETLHSVEFDILEAQRRLEEIAPHQKHWSYCYPCYDTFVGRGRNRQSFVPIVADRFLAGRAGGHYGFANHPDLIDLACVWGMPAEQMTQFEMIGIVEELTARGQWVVFVFHDVSGHNLSVTRENLEGLLKYLDRRREAIWTAPLVEVAQKVTVLQRDLDLI